MQEAAIVPGSNAVGRAFDQASARQWLQASQILGEVFVEVDAMTCFQHAFFDAAVAHELLDQLGAQHVVAAEAKTAPYR